VTTSLDVRTRSCRERNSRQFEGCFGSVLCNEALEDRVIGVLFGMAAGDQIGGPVRMALRVAESLCDRGGFDASDIVARYLEWWRGEAG
jgi:ADP-ribosylglycohydrolase